MKRVLSLIISVVIFVCANCVNTFAIQDDVKSAYINELKWIAKCGHNATYMGDNDVIVTEKCPNDSDIEYCVYDINKDGYKELCVKIGCCEADYEYRFYSCAYGKIVSLGTFSGGHSGLYECDGNGIFVYWGHMGCESLTKISKEGNSIKATQIFYEDLNPLFAKGYDDPWHIPKRTITMYNYTDYSGLY
ncbi:MAG: hypothetical protein ACI4VF_06540 [Lachnospirales bacterium]